MAQMPATTRRVGEISVCLFSSLRMFNKGIKTDNQFMISSCVVINTQNSWII